MDWEEMERRYEDLVAEAEFIIESRREEEQLKFLEEKEKNK